MDIIGCLPPEISLRVLLYLDSKDIEVISNGMEEWKHLFDNFFWKKLCLKNGYQEEEACLCSDIYKESMLKHSLHWQAIYSYNRLIQSNWTSDNYKSIAITENKKYNMIQYFDDEILVANGYEHNSIAIDIIKLSTGNIYFSFQVSAAVKKMIRHQNLLITFASETLQVLNLETKSWNLTLQLEVSRMYADEIHMEVYNNLLAVSNPPHFFYIINLETKKIHLKMLGVLDGCFGDNIIMVVLKSGKKLKVFDLNGKPLMNITYGGGLKVEHIMTKGGKVFIYYSKIAGQRYQKVSLCTIHQETKSLQEIRSIKVYYRMLLFPNEDTMLFWNRKGRKTSTYKIWRFVTKNRFVAFDYNENELVSATANNRYLFLYTEDSILNMWCLETGKFIKVIIRNDMELYFSGTFQVTEKKFAYINSEYRLRIQNYDFIPK